VSGGAEYKGDDQPAPSLPPHEVNSVKTVRGGAGHEGDDQPAPSFSACVKKG
jgi:hypothetical protein